MIQEHVKIGIRLKFGKILLDISTTELFIQRYDHFCLFVGKSSIKRNIIRILTFQNYNMRFDIPNNKLKKKWYHFWFFKKNNFISVLTNVISYMIIKMSWVILIHDCKMYEDELLYQITNIFLVNKSNCKLDFYLFNHQMYINKKSMFSLYFFLQNLNLVRIIRYINLYWFRSASMKFGYDRFRFLFIPKHR